MRVIENVAVLVEDMEVGLKEDILYVRWQWLGGSGNGCMGGGCADGRMLYGKRL